MKKVHHVGVYNTYNGEKILKVKNNEHKFI